MLVFGNQPETLPVSVQQDATTGLPLLSERDSIMQVILAYLALPYSVVAYGCGKKTSLIIDQLIGMGIPPYAISRGLVLEYDMSPNALEQQDYRQRPHSLVVKNPLHQLGQTRDPVLRDMLRQNCRDAEVLEDNSVKLGRFILRTEAEVQLGITRSHVFARLTFWDEQQARVVEQVIDPGLNASEGFAVEKIRDYLHAPQGLIFEAPLLANFHLDARYLTGTQQQAVESLLGDQPLADLSLEQHARLVQGLTGAEPGSLGDPLTWTYANNLPAKEEYSQADKDHFQQQKYYTGRGDGLFSARRQLCNAREQRSGDAPIILAQLRDIIENSDARRIAKKDARWSLRQLVPLADAATVFVYYHSLKKMAGCLRQKGNLLDFLHDPQSLQDMRGIGARLRRRIDWLGRVSREEDGRIDARALTPGFTRATIETIRQINVAGLEAFIDKVGNVHGLLLSESQRKALSRGEVRLADLTANGICHGSHIDTVNDAGKFDGRLGVLSGLETLHVLEDLRRYFDLPWEADGGVCAYMSAFIGEEMTFTGEGVSMPGSAAVAGRGDPQAIHRMRNQEGQRWGECLQRMLQSLKAAQSAGDIRLFNRLDKAEDDGLVQACSDPQDFYSRHSYERHIEQGPLLDRANVPIVQVGTIMGIYQEDFSFEGDLAEAAALELNRQLRRLTRQDQFNDVRITVGILQGEGEPNSLENVYPALRWTLNGEMNHAGATPTPDRRDPGVAAARLVREFLDWFDKVIRPGERFSGVKPVVGNIRLTPGCNRNVIPGSASVTTALTCENQAVRGLIDELTREDLAQTLEGYVIGSLARQVVGGGEGIRLCRVDPVSYVSTYRRAIMSIDLRSDEQEITDRFRTEIDRILKGISERYGVSVRGELQQKLPPSLLRESGQALLMERSYGGSHNPRETELLSDIVRGSLLQVHVTRQVLNRPDLHGFNLFEQLERTMPGVWRDKMDKFTSGALHDTCNIAARARES
ncbi:zinc-binding metallopeptidase family protein [Bowmanella dokdonensis]|uniref:Uncharacterized protein n=1 Tax=Bowmanella dokdonensis TaxID=751969 RepID=A0A939IRU2_9ALTE|nr:hypothetical protein [Bowmanella dokdonensis]MBN7826007.1 hypothetical protein [Bowmanella dokdonensis]